MAKVAKDNFTKRRKHLANLSDKELKKRFWDLAEKVVDPLIELAQTHTSPSIERSVLLRMGFSSLEAKAIVDELAKQNLLGHGAGNVIYKLSQKQNKNIHAAGLAITKGYDAGSLFL